MRRLKYAALPYTAYALVFILAPILLIAYYSFTSDGAFTLEHFAKFFDPNNTVYMRVLVRSIYIAVISTVICFLLGYPMAYILSRMRPKVRTIASVLFILPMWMNFLLRTYAWMTLLERTGVINTFLNSIGLSPINIM
ncbi:MAG: ABC transporter permease, partial [Clostridia bacterium]